MAFTLANIGGRAALVKDGSWFDIARISDGALGPDPMSVVGRKEQLSALHAGLSGFAPDGAISAAPFGAPVPAPSKVFGIGLNYQEHADESSMEVPDNPVVFTKFPSCITGPYDEVLMRSDRCDYEGELVVVIGVGGKDIPVADAWDHVLGLTIGQDVSDRAVQLASKPPHFDLGKSFDTFGPIGPVVVSVDQFADRSNIRLRTLVNDEVRQNETTANLIFDVPFLVNYLSRITTLVAGDLIFTGTPSGVGMPQKKWLAHGDIVVTEIEGIGHMANPCVRTSDHELPLRRKSA
jgi:2-keto-4-pentenoate hydratase/2-oxohepta-3-ene-1,7-dioic acid hydratase in catechol pathway